MHFTFIQSCGVSLVLLAGVHISLNTVLLWKIQGDEQKTLNTIETNQQIILETQKEVQLDTRTLNERTPIINDLMVKMNTLSTKIEELDKRIK